MLREEVDLLRPFSAKGSITGTSKAPSSATATLARATAFRAGMDTPAAPHATKAPRGHEEGTDKEEIAVE